MKLLLTADWHLSDNPRDAYRFGAAELVWKVAREKKVTDLFVLGDLTEDRDHHSARFTNRVVELLSKMAADFRVIIVRGNHDASDPGLPFFRFISNIRKVHYVTEAEVFQFDPPGRWPLDIAVIPNGAWPAKLPECELVLTHHTFAGSTAESGVGLRGLRLPMRSPPIFSGDVHVPQKYGPVTYVGPPTLIKFGDDYQPRIILIDDALRATSVPLTTPTKRLVELVAHPDGKFDAEGLRDVRPGDIVKVRVRFSGEPPPLSHLSADIRDVVGRLHQSTVYSIIPVLDRKAPVPTNPSASRSDADLVRQYASTQGFYKATLEAGLKIVGVTDGLQ